MAPTKETLQNLLNLTPVVLYEYLQDKGGSSKFLYMSPSSKWILGYPREYFTEDIRHFWEIIHPADLESLQVDDKTFKDDFYSSEARIIWPSGEVRWIRFRAKQASMKKEGSLVWEGCIVDVTSLKRTTKKLRESEQRYKDLAELLPEALFEADIDANLTYANPHAFKISGYTREDLDKGLNGIELLAPEDRERARKNLAKRFRGEKIGVKEYMAIKKDGTVFPVLMHTTPMFDQDGTITGVRGIIIDMTERKQAEEELNKYRYRLEQMVNDRTSELEQKTSHLEEANVALRFLLQQREKDKKEIEENIRNDIDKLVYPYLERLKGAKSESDKSAYLDIIESNLREITSQLPSELLGRFFKLTPAEIQVADLVQRGKTTKEIGQLLKLSPTTIASHRQNIRKKLALTNKKMNLRTALKTNR